VTAAIHVYQRLLPVHKGRRDEVTELLEAAGRTTVQTEDGPLRARREDVVLVLGNAGWFPALRRDLLSTPAARRPLVAVWHTEPLPLPRGAGVSRPRRHARELVKAALRDSRANDPATNHRRLRELVDAGAVDVLLTGGPASRQFLAEQGIASADLTLGCHPALGRDLGLERDIDVMFLGATDVPRRRRVLRDLRRHGIDVVQSGSWHDPRFWGEERTRLLNRVRILLNLPRRPAESAKTRLMLGMANGALVVSEPMYDASPFEAGRHYVSADADELPETIRRLLADDEERGRIAAAGHRFATTEVTLERSVGRLLAAIDEALARATVA
jgi:hypothetical protein